MDFCWEGARRGGSEGELPELAGVGAAEIGPLPGVAGEEKDLPALGDLQEDLQRQGHAFVVEGGQGVVQDQGGGGGVREDQVAEGQAQGQVELVRRALAQLGLGGGGQGRRGLDGGGEVPVQQYSIILPSGEFCKVFCRSFSQGGGKAALEGVPGGGEGLQSQPGGVRLPPEGVPAEALLLQSGLQGGGGAGELELPLDRKSVV